MRTLADAPSPAPWQPEASEPMPTGSSAMRGGLGRLTRLRAAIGVLHPMDRQLLLEWMDEISRPMTAREIEQSLQNTILSRTDRRRVVLALKGYRIILLGKV